MTGALNISPSGTSTNATQLLSLTTNSSQLFFNPYFSTGAWNDLVGNGDKGIIFSNGTVNTGNLVIGPWGGAKGIKIQGSDGRVGIGTATPSELLEVNGTIKCTNITRTNFNTGDHIKTLVYSQVIDSITGYLQLTAGNSALWPVNWASVFGGVIYSGRKYTNSTITIDIDAPYDVTGFNGDTISCEVYIASNISDPGTLIYKKTQLWTNAGGGGTRSGAIFPLTASFSGSITLTDFVVKVNVVNSSNDTLTICPTGQDYYTIKITETR
jgi:hypothetical protein